MIEPAQEPGQGPGQQPAQEPAAEPSRGDGVIDLYGLLAYAELVAFFRLSEDGALAPTLSDKAALAGMAVAEFSHFERIRAELERLGADPGQAMAPFTAPLDAFHARTVPSDWLEGLVKAYVGDGFAADFYRTAAEILEPGPRALVLEVLADTGHAQFAVDHVRAAIAADPSVAGRLALWARRLVGEALGQAQRVSAERPPLAHLLADALLGHGSAPAPARPDGQPPENGQPAENPAQNPAENPAQKSELGEIGRMFAQLTDAHAQRMSALGLST